MTSRLVALLLGGAAACDPVWHGEGHLVDEKGAPVSGATVTLLCPSGPRGTQKSTPTGDFSFGGVGSSFEAPRCSAKIEKPGHKARTVRTIDLCYRNSNAGSAGVPCTPGEGTIVFSIDPAYVAPAGDAGGAAGPT